MMRKRFKLWVYIRTYLHTPRHVVPIVNVQMQIFVNMRGPVCFQLERDLLSIHLLCVAL